MLLAYIVVSWQVGVTMAAAPLLAGPHQVSVVLDEGHVDLVFSHDHLNHHHSHGHHTHHNNNKSHSHADHVVHLSDTTVPQGLQSHTASTLANMPQLLSVVMYGALLVIRVIGFQSEIVLVGNMAQPPPRSSHLTLLKSQRLLV